jgi:hypothetical protein
MMGVLRKELPAHGRTWTGDGRNFDNGGRPLRDHCTTAHPRAQIPLRSIQGRVVAHLVDRELHKEIDGTRHMLHSPRGIAFDVAILEAARRAGCELVQVFDKTSGTTYRAAFTEFDTHGVRLNRGFGPQVCLPLTYWHTEARAQLGLFAEAL